MADRISDPTRKRLWTKADDCCAFTGCDASLLAPTEEETADTVLGWECHIVAKNDDPRVARAPSSLDERDRARWASLIEHRHEEANLVLMCPTHGVLIDDPSQGFSVGDIVEMKRLHEEEVRERRRASTPGGAREARTVVHQPLLLEDIPAWQRKATAALARAHPDALSWLRGEIGVPAERKQVERLIAQWPRQLLDGPRELAILLIREAEALAMWAQAARAGERIAAGATGAQRADLLARAAVDAGVGGDREYRERLLSEAEELNPNCARARLERFDDRLEGAEQLAYLASLSSEDAALASMIESQRALAYLRMSDLEGAAESIEKAQLLEPDSYAVRIARISLGLQRARVALTGDKPFTIAHLLDAHDQALELREELVAMGRWVESVRLLMMASDARSLLRDLDGAAVLLEKARPEEVAADQGAAVLGDAALRAGAPELALRFVEGVDRTDDGLRRIAASARGDLGGGGRVLALAELEEMALGDGPEAEAAAVSRLILCMAPTWAKWNDEVAAVLDGTEFEHHATAMRILRMALDHPEHALRLATDLPRRSWAAEVRLRVAGLAGDAEKTAAAAKEFLSFSPDGAGRLLAAQGLAQAKEIERAGEIAASVGRDPNSPARVRSDGFHVTMKTLADRDEWEVAEQTWEEWRDFALKELKASEGRVSAWQVRVIHNRPRPTQPVAPRSSGE
jgi:tetratricopeptide (TPR) repeat protein